jgi:hypothetical protein
VLSEIIPPEIRNDSFYDALLGLARDGSLRTYLEIGSSSGEGSTHAFVTGLRARADLAEAKLFCMEMSRERFAVLADRYRDDGFVHCYNTSSVLLAEFPSAEEIAFFYANTRTNLNLTPLAIVLGWLRQDTDYLRLRQQTVNGIEQIKAEHGIANFDCVLIDGSEFTGEKELMHTLGARVIALDDINAHKNFNCYRMLRSHVGYALAHEDLKLRNGFAIFRRRF